MERLANITRFETLMNGSVRKDTGVMAKVKKWGLPAALVGGSLAAIGLGSYGGLAASKLYDEMHQEHLLPPAGSDDREGDHVFYDIDGNELYRYNIYDGDDVEPRITSIEIHNRASVPDKRVLFLQEANTLFQKLKLLDGMTYSAMTTLVGLLRGNTSISTSKDANITFHLKWIENRIEKLYDNLQEVTDSYNRLAAIQKKGS